MYTSREDLAWAAGFFDGEGTGYSEGSPTRRHRPTIAISQSGEAGKKTLARFQKAIGGLGKVYGPYKPSQTQKQIRYYWQARTFETTQAIMAMLWCFLGDVKRDQMARILNVNKQWCLER